MRAIAVPRERLKHGPDPRDPARRGDVDGLARRILASRWVDPLVVTEEPDGSYAVHDGHRRLDALIRASELAAEQPGRWSTAHLELVPCQVMEAEPAKPGEPGPRPAELQARIVALLANCDRLNLELLDRAEWFQSLWSQDYTWDEIAEMTGYSTSAVRMHVRWSKGLAPAVKVALRAGDRIGQATLSEWCRLPFQTQEEKLSEWQQKRTPRGRRRKHGKRRPRKESVTKVAERLRQNGHPVACHALEWAAGIRSNPPKAGQT